MSDKLFLVELTLQITMNPGDDDMYEKPDETFSVLVEATNKEEAELIVRSEYEVNVPYTKSAHISLIYVRPVLTRASIKNNEKT